MSDLALKERIKNYISKRPDTWINGRDIEELAMQVGYKASNASRRMRELENEGYLDREIRKGRRVSSVWYKWHNFL